MLIYYKFNGELHNVEIHKYASFYHLRKIISKRVKSVDYTIELNGKSLSYMNDETPLDYLNITNGSILNINGKIKGGISAIKVILIIIAAIFVFLVIPMILYCGFLPFIAHVGQLFVVKILDCIISKIFRLPRIAEYKSIFSFIVKCFMLIFQLLFLYYASKVIFSGSYLLWYSTLKGFSNMFNKSESTCETMSMISTLSMVSSICFIIFYGIFRAPNMLFGMENVFIKLLNKLGMSSISSLLDPTKATTKELVYEGKFSFFEAIPIAGQIIMVIFDALDTGISVIVDILSELVQFGCGSSVPTLSIESIKKKLQNKQSVKQVAKNYIKKKRNDYKASKNSQDDDDDDGSMKLSIFNGSNSDDACKLFDLSGCCSDDFLNSLNVVFETMLNNGMMLQELRELGLVRIMKILQKISNTQEINAGVQRFKDAFGPFKLLDNNFTSVMALFLKYCLCNVFYVAQLLQNTVLLIGTPLDISDTIKCGFIGGTITAFIYYFSVICIIFLGLDILDKTWSIVVSIIILIVLLAIRPYIPIPVPLIPL